MAIRLQLRRSTAAQWTTDNPTLAQGEVGVETDTAKMKIGDGTTAWSSLAYFPILVSTKGALLTSTGTAQTTVAVGTDGQALIADSTQAGGLRWGNAGAAGDSDQLVIGSQVFS